MKKLTVPALVVSGLVLAGVMAGCGASPTQPSKQSGQRNTAPRQLRPTTTVPTGQAQMPGQMGAKADPRPILQAVSQASQATQGFTATIDTYDKGPAGTGTQTIRIAYKKPNTLALNIIKDSGGGEGSVALWQGGSDIKVKPKFPPVSVSLSLTDKRIVSKNNWTLKETEVNAIMRVLFDPAADVQVIGPQAVNGKQLTMLRVQSRLSPAGATYEVIGIDPLNNLPAHRSLYKGNELIYKLDIKSMKMGVPSASELSL